MDTYTNELVKQFLMAKGIKNADFTSQDFKAELNKYITVREEIQYHYLDLFDDMEINVYHNPKVAEVGKGKKDTVTAYGDSVILSPYADEVECKGIKVKTKIDASELLTYANLYELTTFITQNPYNENDVNELLKLANRYNYNIIIGVYGFTSDKDKDSKIKSLREFANKSYYAPFEDGYEDSDYGYYCHAFSVENYHNRIDFSEIGCENKKLVKVK